MTHFYKSAKGWRFQADVSPNPATGERRQKRFGPFPTKRAAETAAAKHALGMAEGPFVETTATVAEYLVDQWLPRVRRSKRKATTVDGYEYQVTQYLVPRLGQIRLRDLSGRHVAKFLQDFGDETTARGTKRSPSSVKAAYRVLHAALSDAVDLDTISRNAAAKAKSYVPDTKRSHDVVDWWSAKQLAAFLKSVHTHRLYALWVLFCTTGMRRGEALGIRWSKLDLSAGVVKVRENRVHLRTGPITLEGPKTEASYRTVHLGRAAVQALREHHAAQATERALLGLPPSDYVFTGVHGGQLRPDMASKTFKQLQANTGLPEIHLHNLRHSYITAALEAGVRSEVSSKIVGHASDRVTKEIYTRSVETLNVSAAVEIDALLFIDIEEAPSTDSDRYLCDELGLGPDTAERPTGGEYLEIWLDTPGTTEPIVRYWSALNQAAHVDGWLTSTELDLAAGVVTVAKPFKNRAEWVVHINGATAGDLSAWVRARAD